MTRYLSLALGAEEPVFSHSIQQLEQVSGKPSADIRLSADLQQRVRAKIAELGLDPNDTTGPELYRALQERLKIDDLRIRQVLRLDDTATATDILERVEEVLSHAEVPRSSFALKPSVAKRLLKKKIPKNAMKRLGYRSAESMLKHEPVAQIYAAIAMTESVTWQKAFFAQYSSLHPNDFEMRPMQIIMPQTTRWQKIAYEYADEARHNILPFRELGAIVILPMSAKTDGLAVTVLLLALQAMNDIRAYSSFIKLQQVKPDFGNVLNQAVTSEPAIAAQLAGQQVTWRTIHRYFAQFQESHHPEIFEPHVQAEDLSWIQTEHILAQLEPTLTFWKGTHNLAILHDGQPVSCNMLDVALGYYNNLGFGDRIVHFVRDNIWHDLMLKYLNQQNLEEAVSRQLSYGLVDDLPLAE
jgi:hypothetical protein